MKNVQCAFCQCEVELGEAVSLSFLLPQPNPITATYPQIDRLHVWFCPFCLLSPDLPIPFIVTEKGRAESMRQPAGEEPNA